MFTFENDKYHRMPGHFGGWAYQPAEARYNNVVSITFSHTTDGDHLSGHIPEGFEALGPICSPATTNAGKPIGWAAPTCNAA